MPSENARTTRDMRTVCRSSHGTLQLEEVWTARGDNHGGVLEFPIERLQVAQSVRRPRTEHLDSLQVLLPLLWGKRDEPSDQVPNTPGEDRRRAPPLVLVERPEVTETSGNGVDVRE